MTENFTLELFSQYITKLYSMFSQRFESIMKYYKRTNLFPALRSFFTFLIPSTLYLPFSIFHFANFLFKFIKDSSRRSIHGKTKTVEYRIDPKDSERRKSNRDNQERFEWFASRQTELQINCFENN